MHVCRKDNIFRQRQLSHSKIGEGDYGTQSHAAEPDRWADKQVGIWAGRFFKKVGRQVCSRWAHRQAGGQADRQLGRGR